MASELVVLLAAGIFAIAVLYSSVGHAGASGYIAVMSLASLAPGSIKPTALALNILVATIATTQFMRAGHFSWRVFWPFGLPAVPFAFLGGYLSLPATAFKVILGIILIVSAANLLVQPRIGDAVSPPSRFAAVSAGIVIGLISGLTGTGGGIFLTPLIIVMGWAYAKQAAAVSAPFILLNSIAGLLGNISSTRELPGYIAPLLIAAAIGGAIGSTLGARHFAPLLIKRMLAVVLVIAGLKLIFA